MGSLGSLRVAVPTPRGKTGGREHRSLPSVFPRGGGGVRLHVGYSLGCRIALYQNIMIEYR